MLESGAWSRSTGHALITSCPSVSCIDFCGAMALVACCAPVICNTMGSVNFKTLMNYADAWQTGANASGTSALHLMTIGLKLICPSAVPVISAKNPKSTLRPANGN